MAHLSDDWDVLEADFQRFYKMDLAGVLWRDRVGVRRLWALIGGLPVESGFQRKLGAAARAEAEKPPTVSWRELGKRLSEGVM